MGMRKRGPGRTARRGAEQMLRRQPKMSIPTREPQVGSPPAHGEPPRNPKPLPGEKISLKYFLWPKEAKADCMGAPTHTLDPGGPEATSVGREAGSQKSWGN